MYCCHKPHKVVTPTLCGGGAPVQQQSVDINTMCMPGNADVSILSDPSHSSPNRRLSIDLFIYLSPARLYVFMQKKRHGYVIPVEYNLKQKSDDNTTF